MRIPVHVFMFPECCFKKHAKLLVVGGQTLSDNQFLRPLVVALVGNGSLCFGVIDLQLRSTMLLRLWKIIVGMGHGVGGMARKGSMATCRFVHAFTSTSCLPTRWSNGILQPRAPRGIRRFMASKC